jgi:hypothetical protein
VPAREGRRSVVVERRGADPVRGLAFDRGAMLVVRTSLGDTEVPKAEIVTLTFVRALPEEAELGSRMPPPAREVARTIEVPKAPAAPPPEPSAARAIPDPVKAHATPQELVQAIFEALRAQEEADLERLIPTRAEHSLLYGESEADDRRDAAFDAIRAEYATCLRDYPGIVKASMIEHALPDVVRKTMGSTEVESVEAPQVGYDLAGLKRTVVLGELVRVIVTAEAGASPSSTGASWRLVRLLPKGQ